MSDSQHPVVDEEDTSTEADVIDLRTGESDGLD